MALTSVKTGKCLPLQRWNVEGRILGQGATVTMTQKFFNDDDSPLEAVFIFPKKDDLFLTALKIKTGGKVILGKIMPKEDAQDLYDDSIAEGKGAYLLHQNSASELSLFVGNLAPKQEVSVILTFVTVIRMEGNDLRLMIPLTIGNRYTPQTSKKSTKIVRDDSRNLYELSMLFSLEMPTKISKILSPSKHSLKISDQGTEPHTIVTLKPSSDDLSRDFVLLIKLDKPSIPQIHVERNLIYTGQEDAIFLQFHPQDVFPHETKTEDEEKVVKEFIFLIDQSGSMSGSRMKQAREALRLFFDKLPSNSYFNLVGFGSRYDFLFPASVTSFENQERILDSIDGLKANMGGTEILAPLQRILKSPIPSQCHHRAIFVLTDGEVGNTAAVLNAVKSASHKSNFSLYSIGIGESVSHELVNGLAKAGRGQAEFVMDGENTLPEKVTRQLARVVSGIGAIKIDWGINDDRNDDIIQMPQALYAVAPTDRIQVACILPKQKSDHARIVKFHTRQTTVEFVIDNKSARIKEGDNETFIHKLVAAEQITALQGLKRSKEIDSKIAKLSLRYGVASRLTSFVAVEERVEAVHGSMKTTTVPLAKPRAKLPTAGTSCAKVNLGGGRFSCSYKSTIGADFQTLPIILGNGMKPTVAQIWDTAGQERFQCLGVAFYRGCDVCLFVYSVVDAKTLLAIENWLAELKLQCGDSFDDIVIGLLGNKIDLPNHAVNRAEGEEFAANHSFLSFYEVSAKTAENIGEAVGRVLEDLYRSRARRGEDFGVAKVLILGESGVGKTSIGKRIQGSVDLSELVASMPIGTSATSPSESFLSLQNSKEDASWCC